MSATRFPKIRRFMRLRAVLVPCLMLAAFLAFARSMVVVGFVLAGLAFCLLLGFTGPQEELVMTLPQPQGFERWRYWCGQIVRYVFMIWLISQPELELGAFLHRVSHAQALWDWRLIVPAIVLTTLSIISGWRRVSEFSDQEIYDWLEEK
jgi:hypothetical protein